MRMTQFTASPDSLNRQGIPQGVSVERHEGGATTIRIRQGDDCTMVYVTYKDQEAIGALRAAMASLPKVSLYYQLIVMDARGFWSPKFGDCSRASEHYAPSSPNLLTAADAFSRARFPVPRTCRHFATPIGVGPAPEASRAFCLKGRQKNETGRGSVSSKYFACRRCP
jgi:hypothetical protein